ncbi:tRNA dihydrouridine synthase [Thermospira aquatica]|uniref:tRNA-dihydrouridine synthase n=1 Tax=Thermospira aquatica TaxID=2828656 RepID=A0AAX3BEH3_9SPIR|nr:tRNA-dihydrouridine synthase family protein [Thermospira aquatica]URA10449.1 tRNA-dihydrouridine synthase family protein [Thermospira aquatica]
MQLENRHLSIGGVTFSLWAGAAPLAGFSHRAYRDWLRRWGAGFVVSEMVSVEGLYREDKKSWELLDVIGEENPWIQLFGKSEPAKWYAVTQKVTSRLGIRLVDVNFGCPVKKVVKNQAGSALLAFPKAMGDIIGAIKDAGAIATAKVRLGIDSPLWEAFLPELVKAGVDALTVHGRYASQFYSGQAHWDQIRAIRQVYSGILIGNGDITSPELAVQRRMESGVDGVMIGRHAIGAPYIFRQIREYLDTGSYSQPSCEELRELLLEYASLYLSVNHTDSLVPVRATLLAMIRGYSQARKLRQQLSHVKTYQELKEVITQFSPLL